jgi:UDP-2-acetamido-3-amino-2,3-dideoxy-glucuronate N-acetyltransferase
MSITPNIAVIGSGYWGKNLIRNYHNLGALKLICDKNPVLLDQYKEQYPDVETCLSLHDVISRDDIKGLVIATPAETHYTLAREGILAGKHVYVEKPLVLDEKEGEALIELAAEHNRTLMVGHLLQYHPAFVRLKELALSGELGRVNYIYSHRLNLGKIRREENILWSFAPHDISMILALACETPEKVSATGGNYLHRKIADVTTTHLEFSSGLKAHIFVSWLHPFKEQKLVVVGDRKMAVFDDTLPWSDKLLLYPHEIKWQNNMPVPEKGEPERVDIPESEPLRLECEHFLLSFTNGNRPQTDGEEGLRVLKILNAAQLSLNNNGRSVELRSVTTSPSFKTQNSEPKIDNQLPPFKTQHSKFKIDSDPGIQSYSESAVKDYSNVFIHSSAFIDENVNIGSGTKIWHFSHILKNCTIGETCTIGQNVVIGPDVTIGKECKIQNNVSVYKGVTLEEGVFCGPSMVFTNIYNPRAQIVKMDQVRPTLVKQGATIGANATIICGVTLGRYSFIGAGSVVTKDIDDYALVMGNPARQVGHMCECGERLDESISCIVCGKKYEKYYDGLKPLSSDF